MTRSELKTQYTGLMNRRDLTSNTALVNTFLDQAIIRVQRELRVPAMEKSVDVTIADDYAGLVIPSDMLELKEIRPAASQVKLRKTSLDRAYAASTSAGTPTIYARQGGLWILGPSPDTDDVIRVTYYAELSPLTEDDDENIISIIAWDLIVNAACKNAAQWFNDKRKDDFEGNYQQILMDLQEQADADELGDDASMEPALYYPDEETC